MRPLIAMFAALALMAVSSGAIAQDDCPSGTHWDEDVQACVSDDLPDEA